MRTPKLIVEDGSLKKMDVILNETLPAPTAFGLRAENADIEVFTEFLDSPNPKTEDRATPKGMPDRWIEFGEHPDRCNLHGS